MVIQSNWRDLAEEPEMLVGRNYEIMQNELDGDFSKMHVKIRFRVTEVLGNDAITEFIGHQMMQDHVRRQVRRDRGKIDDTIDVVTEDGFYVRFKPNPHGRKGEIKPEKPNQDNREGIDLESRSIVDMGRNAKIGYGWRTRGKNKGRGFPN